MEDKPVAGWTPAAKPFSGRAQRRYKLKLPSNKIGTRLQAALFQPSGPCPECDPLSSQVCDEDEVCIEAQAATRLRVRRFDFARRGAVSYRSLVESSESGRWVQHT